MTDYQPYDYTPPAPPAPPTYAAPAPPPPPSPAPKRGRKIAAAVVGIAVVAAIAVVLAVTLGGSSKPKQIDVHGALALTDPTGFISASTTTGPCFGDGGYDDIAKGASVVITDDTGKTLTINDLGAGEMKADGSCVFPFAATVPAGKKFYGVTISHRGTVKFEEAQMSAPELSLGS